MITIIHENHRIDVKAWGKEKVLYDGCEMTSKWSMMGSTHVFQVEEDGERATYEVEIYTRWHGLTPYVQVRRNGIMIFTNK